MPTRPNEALSQIHMQIMWSRLIAVVEEQAQTLVRTAFSTSVREAGDLSAGVFDRDGNMLAQAVTGTPGHVNSMAAAVKHFLDAFPLATMSRGRPLHHQRPLADLRPSARSDRRQPDLSARRAGRAVRQHGACRRYRRARHGAGRAAGLRRGSRDPADAVGARGTVQRGSDAHRARQCSRAAAGRGRHLCARRVQRRGQPAPRRDDGRIRHRQSRPARRAHHRDLEAGDDRRDRPAQTREIPLQRRYGRVRPAAASRRRDDDLARQYPSRLCRHLAGQRLRHQCRDELHARLYGVRREMPRRAGGAEQCRLAGADHRERARGLRPQRQAAARRRGAAHRRAHAARSRVRLPASGHGRRRAGRGRLVAVEPADLWRRRSAGRAGRRERGGRRSARSFSIAAAPARGPARTGST